MVTLRADKVYLSRGGRSVLEDLTLTVRPGELVVIVGPNGAGKSSLLQLLAGTLKPTRGEAFLEGRSLHRWSVDALARQRAMLPQGADLGFAFQVIDVVLLGRSAWPGDAQSDLRIAGWALAETGLKGFEERRYTQLSGGERQRVQLARVLAQLGPPGPGGARYLLLDEPTNNLDLQHQRSLMITARRLAAAGYGVVAILHDLNLAGLYADRLYLLAEGRLLVSGPPAEVLALHWLSQAYGPCLRVQSDPESGRPLVLPAS